MKKYVIPVVLALVLLLGSAGYLVSTRINYAAYANRLVTAAAYLEESGTQAVSEFDGRRAVVEPANIGELIFRLTPSGRQPLYRALPSAGGGLTLTLDLGGKYLVTAVQPEPDASADDTCYIELCDAGGGHAFRCKTSGVNTLYWLAAACGFEEAS